MIVLYLHTYNEAIYIDILFNPDFISKTIQYFRNIDKLVKYILKIYAKLFSCLFKLKSLPLPIFIRSKIGVSQHFGSSLPPCENETIGNTLKNGELAFHKNIYVTDCSSLNRIPSTPPTFISMSNAYRISENITKNC